MRHALAIAVACLLAGGTVAAAAAEPERREDPPTVEVPGTPYFAGESGPPVPAGALAAATWQPPPTIEAQLPTGAGLPPGMPPAAYRLEPGLPEADGWAFGDGFPRTSGTGRYAGGAYFWSDFLYDDNGAVGVPPPTNESTGAPSFGTYRYPAEAQRGNGADLFRVAIGREDGASVWRVDWNTLVDAAVPIAAFTIDHDPGRGATAWPAGANVSSPGIDTALVLSAAGGQVVDLATGAVQPLPITVDREARSFVLRVPEALLPTTGEAVVRVAAGLAGPDGASFLSLTPEHGTLPGQPNVYNVGFRDYGDEPSAGNTWYDTGQARALTAGGDVSAFAATLDWDRLAARATEPEPIVTGYTNRWYVSSIEVGQGVADPGQGISVNGAAAYLGRVQPYGIFVPSAYDGRPVPLTWMLHGASSSHNSVQVHPRFLDAACEQRTSICLSPLGRGPSGGWRGVAELDVWEVWNRVAGAFALDPDRTAISGISMGGFGTYQLAADHPEAFASAAAQVANAERAGYDRLTNYRWIPLYAWHGALDQLVPITTELETQDHLDAAGLRHVFDFHPAEDHIVVALKDGYDDVADFFKREHRRERSPARVSYGWSAPSAEDRALGLERVGAYWLDAVATRDAAGRGRIEATSHALSDRPHTVVSRKELRPLAAPSPAIRTIMDWELGEAPPVRPELEATLTNVAALTLDLAHAGLGAGQATVTVTTDGPTRLTLAGLGARKARLERRGQPLGAVIVLPAGRHVLVLR